MYLKIENSKAGTGTLIKHRQTDRQTPPTPASNWFGMETTQYYFSFSSLIEAGETILEVLSTLFREFKNKKNRSFSAWWQRKAKSLEVC